MGIEKFRTPQEIVLNESNPKGDSFIIGLDIGYGSVKIFFENGHICFPSYVRRLEENVTSPDSGDILYRDDDSGRCYIVGKNAQDMVGPSDTNDTDAELFSRNRYSNPGFRILCNTALGLAVEKRRRDDRRKIAVQSSLPASYLEADSGQLAKAFTNNARFSLKRGEGPWKSYSLLLDAGNIAPPIQQPMAAMYSAVTRPDGSMARGTSPGDIDSRSVLAGNTLVIDAGFETLDLFGAQARRRVCTASIDDLGMCAVLGEARKLILKETGEDIRVIEIQKHLTSGKFTATDEENMRRTEFSIAPFIEKANAEVLERAKVKLKGATDSFRGYDTVIIAGGTGAAWFRSLKEWLSGMNLKIYPSNCCDKLEMYMSIARGDYMYRRAMEIGGAR